MGLSFTVFWDLSIESLGDCEKHKDLPNCDHIQEEQKDESPSKEPISWVDRQSWVYKRREQMRRQEIRRAARERLEIRRAAREKDEMEMAEIKRI